MKTSSPATPTGGDVDADRGALTLEEKATLLTGASAWTTAEIPRLGISSIRMADGPHGVRRTHASDSMAFRAHPATCFPTASCTAATWDPDLVREMGRAIGREARAIGVDIVLGPGANMKRSPLCGRNFEYFSEDPHLAGRLAAAWIEGIQAEGVGASLKHFAANNQETRRMSVSAEIDERALREIYLPAFETAVRRSRPWTVMCAYNRVNGVYASEDRSLLTDILRTEWGFEGFVVSDWGAVHDRPRSLEAGLDLEMPGPRPRRAQSLVDAVRSGALDETVVDESVSRILRIGGLVERRPEARPFDPAEHHALARRIAAAGAVLLKNDGLLPLPREGRIAVVGRAAVEPRIQGGGSSETTPAQVDVPLEEMDRQSGAAEIAYAEGYLDDDEPQPDLIAEAARTAAGADVAVVFVGLPPSKESEGFDRSDLDLPTSQVALIQAVATAQPRSVVVLFNGSAVALEPWIGPVAAVLETWYAGQAAGGAIADVLFGDVDPSGRLAETFPVRIEDTPAYLDFPGDGDRVSYGEGQFIGYRWYDARRIPVSFPFGYGLSYTTFAYGDPRVSADRMGVADGVTVSVDLTNTGSRFGSEVVQVYVHDVRASVRRPVKELRGFQKVSLAPGETRTVAIDLDARSFAFWDPASRDWVSEPGDFDIQVGSSAEDIRGSIRIALEDGTAHWPVLTAMSPLQDWLLAGPAQLETRRLLREMGPILGGVFGAAADEPEDLDPHFFNYFGTMPLKDVLEFAAAVGGPDPDARLAQLLAASRGEPTG